MPDYLTPPVIGFFLVFARVAGMLMLLPAIGDENVPAQIRLLLGLVLTAVVYPAVLISMPASPATLPGLTTYLVGEILIGVMLGAAARMLMTSLQVTGTLIGLQSGLASAALFDPAQGGQTLVVSRFLGVLGVLLIFTSNLHHLLIGGMVRSYALFRPGGTMMAADFAQLSVRMVATSFALGVQLATPFIVYGIIYNVGLGLMARLTPQIQVFFIAQPLGVLLSLLLLFATLGMMMTVFLAKFGDALRGFLGS